MPRVVVVKVRAYIRQRYMYDFKWAVLTYAEHIKPEATIDRYFPGIQGLRRDSVRKLIWLWRLNDALLKLKVSKAKTKMLLDTRPLGLTTNLPSTNESYLVSWVRDLSRAGIPVTRYMFSEKAMGAANLFPGDDLLLKASWSWSTRFLRT